MKKQHPVRSFILKAVVFILLTSLVTAIAAKVVKRKDSDEKYRAFFEEEGEFDVLFFGSSTVMNGIYPMELWEEQGFTSYNFGGHGNHIPVSYWIMENALDYKTPKLMVIDVYFLEKMDRYRTDVQQMHQSLDAFKLSPTKYLMIRELFTKDSMFYDNRFEFLFPFGSYHDRWTELTSEDFDPHYNTLKGAEMRIDVAMSQERADVSADDMDDTFTTGKAYLERWIEECQRKGIDVLLINLPRAVTEEEQQYANSAQLIADKYGIGFINFTYEDTVNFDLDFYDTDGHLNPSGARKVTDYLGEYIAANYDLTDHRGEAEYRSWTDAAEGYIDEKAQLIDSQEYLETYLMLLNDDDFRCDIQIAENSEMAQDARVAALLEQLYRIHGNTVSDIKPLEAETDPDTGEEKNPPEILVKVYKFEGGEMVSEARFGQASSRKPKDESLDYVVYYANDRYIRD